MERPWIGEVGCHQFTNKLHLWTHWSPVDDSKKREKRNRLFQTQQQNGSLRKCVYCHAEDHTPSNCIFLSSPQARKEFLLTKRLCFGQYSQEPLPGVLSEQQQPSFQADKLQFEPPRH